MGRDATVADAPSVPAALGGKPEQSGGPPRKSNSITTAARASSIGGTARPSASSAFGLMDSSNLVVISTGRSPGFASFISCRQNEAANRVIGAEAVAPSRRTVVCADTDARRASTAKSPERDALDVRRVVRGIALASRAEPPRRRLAGTRQIFSGPGSPISTGASATGGGIMGGAGTRACRRF
jgi:hypothetical protein